MLAVFQSIIKDFLSVFRKAVFLRRTKAATIIQSKWRSYFWRQRYCRMRAAIVAIQVGKFITFHISLKSYWDWKTNA